MQKKFAPVILMLFLIAFPACNNNIDSEYDCQERIYVALMRLNEILQDSNPNEDANLYSLSIVYTTLKVGEDCFEKLEKVEQDPRYKEFWRSQRERLPFDW